MTKRTASELVELALIYAIQDREAMVDACHFEDSAGKEAAELAKELRAYHKRRYRKAYLTSRDEQISKAKSVSIFDLKLSEWKA